MKPEARAVDKNPARPRDPRIDAVILRAAVELVVQVGHSDLTLAAVAERVLGRFEALFDVLRRWVAARI